MGTGFLAFFAFGAVGDGVSGSFLGVPVGTEFPAFSVPVGTGFLAFLE